MTQRIPDSSRSEIAPDKAEAPLILSLDLGTSAVRAMLFDSRGRSIAGGAARHPIEVTTRPDGAAVIDPGPLLDATWNCIDATLNRAGPLEGEIRGVGCCAFASSILGVDERGRPVTPVILYADTRAAEDAATLHSRLDEETVHQRTGCIFHPSYLPARFVWLARTRPDLMRKNIRWMSIGEYLALQLFGTTAVSYSAASWTGLLDRHRLEWDEELLDALPVAREQLSPLVDVDHAWRGLHKHFAKRWPPLREKPWFPAVGDGAAANLGSGCINSHQVALTIGTSTAIRAVMTGEVPSIPKGLWCYRVNRESSLLGGALSEGGNVLDWIRGILKLDRTADLDEKVGRMPPDEHGLVFLPFLAGERSPGWIGSARGIITGLSLSTTPLDVMRAGLEGIAYRIGLIFKLISPRLPSEVSVIASGGTLLHSPALAQIIADVMGHSVTLSAVQEASARGVAMLALCSLGDAAGLVEFPSVVGETFAHDPQKHLRYEEAMKRQQTLYEKLVAAREPPSRDE